MNILTRAAHRGPTPIPVVTPGWPARGTGPGPTWPRRRDGVGGVGVMNQMMAMGQSPQRRRQSDFTQSDSRSCHVPDFT